MDFGPFVGLLNGVWQGKEVSCRLIGRLDQSGINAMVLQGKKANGFESLTQSVDKLLSFRGRAVEKGLEVEDGQRRGWHGGAIL